MKTFEQVIEGKMTPEEYSAFRDTISSQAVTPATSVTAPATPQTENVITTPSGQRLQRTAVPGYFIIAQ